MNASPAVSVIIPAFNHGRYVGASIESVLAQTLADFEIVIVDDASTDDTWARVTDFDDRRVRAIRQPENQGAHAAINRGIAESRAPLLAILNSDDLIAPQRLERFVDAAHAAPCDAFFGFSDVAFIDANGGHAESDPRAADYRSLREFCIAQAAPMWFVAGNPAISSSNFVFSRSLYERVGAFAELRYTHDWDWAARAAHRCAPTWLHEPLLSYRIHATNTLGEGDAWRHIHENSYVQAEALLRLIDDRHADPQNARAFCLSLLRNDSLHPLSLVCFAALRLNGLSADTMRAEATHARTEWLLEAIARDADYPEALFGSSRQLIDDYRTVAVQAKLIDERWATIQHMNKEIADRDAWIADLQQRLESSQKAVMARDGEIDSLKSALAQREDELAAMRASRFVRAALRLRDLLGKAGLTHDDPRLRKH